MPSNNQVSNTSQNNSNEISTTKSNDFLKTNYTFRWNFEPYYVLCLFPYVIGLGNQSIEIRLLVNGNLINSLTMSNIKLIASKVIYLVMKL